MKIVYSIDARFGASGIGYTAYNAVTGTYHKGWLERLYVNSNAQTIIPTSLIWQWGNLGRATKYLAVKDPSGLIYYLENLLFDSWVAPKLPNGALFHGWAGASLFSIRKAKRHGMATLLEYASADPQTVHQILSAEYQHWNVPLRLPTWNNQRVLREIQEADYINVPSAFVRRSLLNAGVPDEKLIEIPLGVDVARFTPRSSDSSHPFRVIFAGQVSIRKGVPYLLEAWRKLKWSDAELSIVGGISPEFQPLRHQWANIPGVKFIAYTLKLEQLLRESDVFVFPTLNEGSALVTYEAMACGLPIITTFNSGSVVRDREDGFIVPIRDVDALCMRLNELRADQQLRRRMGQAARLRVEQFTWIDYRDRLLGKYTALANFGQMK